jgi:tellurite resistance protein
MIGGMKLGKDVFLELCRVGWADGEMTSGEAAVLLRAARASGLSASDLEAVERATQSQKAALRAGKVSLASASEEAAFVYALACLLSASDGTIDESEREAIAAVGDRLRIPLEVRARAAAASLTVAKSLGAGDDAIAALSAELEGRR